ncbi:MAG: septal ring lytic transglycosylase RlpA family protein [Methylocystis sp.]|uniref:septal ring lytic transglycosylase RlpA family protein n=1 Tax=Methylocystis sp. TaxID=1911079 RepID=UPI003DA3F233
MLTVSRMPMIFLRRPVALLSLAALAGCSSTAPGARSPILASLSQVDARYGVRASPRVVADGEEVPKGGGNYMVGKPYKIAGQTYVPNEKPYSVVGSASWYGSDFHGRRTANGEVFDRQSISAAHPTMPLPSYARVTNLKNSRSMVVRVNDRGPYHGGRVMDVSQRVAEALDFRSAGTAKIKVEWIGRANLAGDDDAMLLATLRDDGEPAQLDAGAPVMVAAKQEPVRTASAGSGGDYIAPGADLPSRETEMTAYAAPEATAAAGADATIVPAPAEQLDVEATGSTQTGKPERPSRSFAVVPMPPVRPASLGSDDSPAPRPPQRHG